jgi:hypothetical protein
MKYMNCVANGANKVSLAAILPSSTPSLLKNLAGNDFSSLQQLFLGPDRSGAAVGFLEGKGTNAVAQGIGAIPIGPAQYLLGVNGAGTYYVRDVIVPKIATSALGTAVATASAVKAAWDFGSYVAGFGTCAIWGS